MLREGGNETGFHHSGSRRFGQHRQGTDVASDLCWRVWIENAMDCIHPVQLAATSTLFAERVLITPFLPDSNLSPWLCWEKILERMRRKYGRFIRLAITVPGSI